MQIGLVKCIKLNDADRADPRRGKICESRTAEPSSSDDENACVSELRLAFNAQFRQDHLARVVGGLACFRRRFAVDPSGVAFDVVLLLPDRYESLNVVYDPVASLEGGLA